MINVFQPSLAEEELEAVRKVFESNWIGKGKLTNRFEAEFAQHLGVQADLVRSVSCCTEGLFQAMALLGVGPGDEVILPTISFVGAGNAVASTGATPIFCDVDPRSLNVTVDTIAAALSPRTKAVMLIHYGGVPCDMDAIAALLAPRAIPIVEDSACSVSSTYKGRAAGTIGDIGIWSFDAMKILVCGDGGMVYCRTPEMAQRAEENLYLGLVTKSGFASKVDEKWWEFDISGFGRRAIMNDVSSAIGLEQIKKLPGFIARRKQIHEMYDAALADQDWLTLPPAIPNHVTSSYYFYWVQVPGGQRDAFARYMRENGVYCTFRYYPLHRVAGYGSNARLPNADRAADSTLCIPIHQSLSDADVAQIVELTRAYGRTHATAAATR